MSKPIFHNYSYWIDVKFHNTIYQILSGLYVKIIKGFELKHQFGCA